MAQKRPEKKKPLPAPAPAKQVSPGERGTPSASQGGWYFLGFFVLAFILYAQTFRYDFAYDDRIVIFENEQTMRGVTAIPDIFASPYFAGSVVPEGSYQYYRPVSKSVFALCWTLGGNNPALFHFASVFFFALSCALLFIVLFRSFSGKLLIPLITTLLFVVHPIHTEVVDNVKSLDEIMSFLFFLLSWFFLLRYHRDDTIAALVLSASAFFFAFISKESGIVFLAAYPLLLFQLGGDIKKIVRVTGVMLLVTAGVFLLRWLILGEITSQKILETDNILAGTKDFVAQRATAIYLIGKYLLLLLFPHPLVCDYSIAQIGLVKPYDLRVLLSLVFLLGTGYYVIRNFLKRDWIVFGVLFFAISFSLTSNLVYICGSHFAERFMYAPSLGFCLVGAVLLDTFTDRARSKQLPATLNGIISARPMLSMAVLAISILYGLKTVTQNPVWRNNITLFENGVKHSPQSYKMHLSLAQDLAAESHIKQFPPAQQRAIYDRAISEALASLRYHPDADAYDVAGNIYYITGRYDSALYQYLEGLKIEPGYEVLNFHAGKALDKLERYREAIPYLEKALAKDPDNDGVLYNLALSYTNLNEIDKGLEYFMKVIKLRPNGPDAYHYSGLIYRAKGDLVKADEYLRKAQALGGPR